MAVEKGNVEIVKLLLTNDMIDFNLQSNNEKFDRKQNIKQITEISPLQYSIKNNQDKIIGLLLSQYFFKQ